MISHLFVKDSTQNNVYKSTIYIIYTITCRNTVYLSAEYNIYNIIYLSAEADKLVNFSFCMVPENQSYWLMGLPCKRILNEKKYALV